VKLSVVGRVYSVFFGFDFGHHDVIRLALTSKMKAEVKKMTPDGGAAGVKLRWTRGIGGRRIQRVYLRRIDLRDYKLLHRLAVTPYAKYK
jgi:hypothetical protein